MTSEQTGLTKVWKGYSDWKMVTGQIGNEFGGQEKSKLVTKKR